MKVSKSAPTTQPKQPPATLPETGFIRISELIKIIPFSASTIWRKAKNGTFPKPYKLSEQITAFDVVEVKNWIIAQKSSGGNVS
ncbi:MAG: AlpA family phage regulatory protein [Methylococcales bacterium]|nr:AlpA family phage regulatory protein [Methylococcales bacterium]